MIRLGYHPIPDDLNSVLTRGGFLRAVVIDESIADLYDAVESVRTATTTDTGLPAGLYWFDGIDIPLVMQVAVGPTGASAELELEVWDDAVEHPLAEAL